MEHDPLDLVDEAFELNLNNCKNSDTWLPNTSQEKYGSHWSGVFKHSRYCFYCGECRPALLEELTFTSILNNPALLKKVGAALSHIPQRLSRLIGHALNTSSKAEASQLVEFVDGEKTQLSWFCADDLAFVPLLRFRFCCEVYRKLKPFLDCPSKGIAEILEYLSDFNNGYVDFWSTMNSAMQTLQADIDLGVFKKKKFSKDSNVVAVNIYELRGRERCIDSSDVTHEFESFKELQKLTRFTAYPIKFHPTTLENRHLESYQIPTLLEGIDRRLISEVFLRSASSWTAVDVQALQDALLSCDNLSCVYLEQAPTHKDTPTDAAEALLRLVGNLPRITELGFSLLTLGSALGRYPLPASVEELRLVCCRLTEPGFERMPKVTLKHLEVIYSLPDYTYQGLFELIKQQAGSLEWLALDFHLLHPFELDELLTLMVRFDKLQRFHLVCFLDTEFSFIENIFSTFVSIRCAKSFFVDFEFRLDEDELKSRMARLLKVMKSSCLLGRRPPVYLRLTRDPKECSTLKTFWTN